jgi:AraC-like DNA-binding protein
VEVTLAGLNKFTKLTLGDQAQAIYIEVAHDPGPPRVACEQQFGAPILINQSRNAVVFKSALLDQPLPGAVPDLHRKAQQIVEQQLPNLPELRISHQIENMFRRYSELMGQGIDRIADRLNLHPRTLQRRLRDDGQVFGDIQARCRYEVAVTQLKSDLIDIETLSDQLGFSDRHSFTRAFKRWTGQAPSEFRKQHLEQLQADRK